MAIILGVVSQKGGVGKSTIARLIARELASQDWQVKIADLDISQATSYHCARDACNVLWNRIFPLSSTAGSIRR